MRIIDISSLPKVNFAHVYRTDSYFNIFSETENLIEITYVAEGELKINDNGIKGYTASKGDVICLLHSGTNLVFSHDYHCHHTVAASVKWSATDDEAAGLCLPIVTPASTDTGKIREMIDSIIHKQEMYKTVSVKGAAKFLDLLCAIDKCNRKAEQFDVPSTTVYVQRAKEYVHRNIHKPILQNTVAEHLGISSGYLCALFKKTEGTTLMKYINKTKLESMKAMMDIEKMHLKDVAPLFGYSDPNYVSRLFKQIFGYNITEQSYTFPEKIPVPEK